MSEIEPDYTDPGWFDVKHNTKTLACMDLDHAACRHALYCLCFCHERAGA